MRCLSLAWCLFALAFPLHPAGGDGQPEQLKCHNDYLREMVCSWDIDPDTNCLSGYSLQYQLVALSLDFTEVTDINPLPGSKCQCRIMGLSLVISAKYDIKVLFKGTLLFSKYIVPSQTIKPLAPKNLTINNSKDKHLKILVWENDYADSFIEQKLEYQVAYMNIGGNWMMINTSRQKMLVLQAKLDPGNTYYLKVRSKPADSYGGSWSDWSRELKWTYDFDVVISPTLIIVVCILVPLPVALCFFGFKFVKKSWWEDIPSPKNSAISKKIFNNSQDHQCVFSEKKFDACKVEKVECTKKLPRDKEQMDIVADLAGSAIFNFPPLHHLLEVSGSTEKLSCPHFPGFSFPALTDSVSPFPLPFGHLSPGGLGDVGAFAKAEWTREEEEEGGYRPFMPDGDGDSPLSLSTYSLSPGAGSQPAGYQAFSNCVSTPWAKATGSGQEPGGWESAELMQPPPGSAGSEPSDYMPSDQLTFQSSSEAVPNWDWAQTPNTPGSASFFPMDCSSTFPDSLQSWAFPVSAGGEPWCWQPPSMHGGPGTAPTSLVSSPVPTQDCCLRLDPHPGTAGSLPGTAGSHLGTAGSHLGTAGSLPDTAGSHPGTAGSHPGTAGSLPGTAGSHPGTAGSHPGTAGSHLGTAGSHPGTVRSHPGTAGSLPDTAGSLPGTAGSLPGTAGSHPGTAGSHPGTAGSHLGTAGSHLGTAGSHPGTAGSHLGTAGSHLGTAGSHPGTAGMGTEANSLTPNPVKYIVVPEDAEMDLGKLTPYMKVSLLNVPTIDKRQGAKPSHPHTKLKHLKCEEKHFKVE
uniref:uncharacterized protein il4r.2 n=1 Tax=Pristiophorus japonicus TaxID=55135 RepID=UPI00398EAF92